MGACAQSIARAGRIPAWDPRCAASDDLEAVAALLAMRAGLAPLRLGAAELRARRGTPGSPRRRAARRLRGRDGGRAARAQAGAATSARARARRARERGFRTLNLTAGAENDVLRRHGFELVARDARAGAPARRPGRRARVARRDPSSARSSRPTQRPCTRCSTRRIVRGTAGTSPLAHDDWLRWMTGDPDFDPTVWWLAERDGELVGCALHWRTGLLKDLAVRGSERGRGLGAALVQQGLAEFARRGVDRVGLKVDAANPTGAVRLYERLGFVVERREAVWASSL